jgi:hypothetical protein
MTDLTANILPRIENHQIDRLPLSEEMLFPNYKGLSLVNIPGTITQLLGAPSFGKPALDEAILEHLDASYEKVILVLSDALGYNLLRGLMESNPGLVWSRYLDRAVFSPITSIVPSTTASALTTLWTGEGAAAHGIIGYEMWAKELGMVMNNILHSPASAHGDVGGLIRMGFNPHVFLDMPLLGTHLKEHGIPSTAFLHSSIGHSGLSVMQLEDVNLYPYVDEADLCVSLADFVNGRAGIREYIYVYYSHVDTLMHRFSDEDSRVSLQFNAFSDLFDRGFLQKLSSSAAEKTLLILTADHGSMTTPRNPGYDLQNHPELWDCFVMQPTCENRLAFLFIKPGRMEDVRVYIEKIWPDEFLLLDPDNALNEGLFGEGPFKRQTRERLGDLIVAAKGDAYLWWAKKPNPLAGRHGGLSSREMLVPFYALPLDLVR